MAHPITPEQAQNYSAIVGIMKILALVFAVSTVILLILWIPLWFIITGVLTLIAFYYWRVFKFLLRQAGY